MVFPCFFFTEKQYKEQEAESSLGICGLIVEAVSLLVPLEMEVGSVGDTNDISLACKFDLYTKGIWACLLSPLAVLELSWPRRAGGLFLR